MRNRLTRAIALAISPAARQAYDLANQKRLRERELRAQGMSRAQACAAVAREFARSKP